MNFPTNIEQWRLIDGYDNYEISSHGRVRNNKTSKIRKLQKGNHGYIYIELSKGGCDRKFLVHRLVGFAFLEKQEEDIEVDHIDHNRTNNMITNLRWTTKSGNQRNKTKAKNNKSGNQGVSFDKKSNSWIASWNDEKRQRKSFSVGIYGEDVAKQMAIDLRKQKAEENGYLNV